MGNTPGGMPGAGGGLLRDRSWRRFQAVVGTGQGQGANKEKKDGDDKKKKHEAAL